MPVMKLEIQDPYSNTVVFHFDRPNLQDRARTQFYQIDPLRPNNHLQGRLTDQGVLLSQCLADVPQALYQIGAHGLKVTVPLAFDMKEMLFDIFVVIVRALYRFEGVQLAIVASDMGFRTPEYMDNEGLVRQEFCDRLNFIVESTKMSHHPDTAPQLAEIQATLKQIHEDVTRGVQAILTRMSDHGMP